MIYINDIKETFLDYPNDTDQAVIIFFEGCSHNCEDCQNKELQIRNKDHEKFWDEVYDLVIDRCKRVKTNKIVFSGGDPYFDKNKSNLKDMMRLISSLEDSGYEICVYTGYTIDQIEDLYEKYGTEEENFKMGMGISSKIIKRFYLPTYLKCGKYNKHLLNPGMGKSDDAFILASSNQAFYKKVSDLEFKYNCISVDGILKFR